MLSTLVFLSVAPFASAQPKTPEHLLPANSVAYFRYDGYAAHRKAYDQTALAKAMKEGLSDFLDHAFAQLWLFAGDDAKKAEERRPSTDRFLQSVWDRGLSMTLEISPPRSRQPKAEDWFQLTVVFPQGAQPKNRPALDNFFRMIAEALDVPVEDVKYGSRKGFVFSVDELKAVWWAEGEHLAFTLGTEPAPRSIDVIDGRRANVTSAKWYPEMTARQAFETDMRGHIDLAAVVDRLAVYKLDGSAFANFKDHLARQVLLRHLGLTGLKDLNFHLGFDGKFQRSTVRLGVVAPKERTGLLRLASTGSIAFDPKTLPPLPPDADYVSVRHVDWENLHSYLRTTHHLREMSELLNGELTPRWFPGLDGLFAMDLHKDLLDQFDSTVVTWGAHSEGPFFLGQGFAVKLKDAAKVRKSLHAVTKALGEKDPKMVAKKKTYRGIDMYIFDELPLPLTYTLKDDWLVFGLFPQPVQGFLLRSGGKYRVWKMPEEVEIALAKEAKANGNGKLLSVSVSDPRPTVTIGLALLPAFTKLLVKTVDVVEVPNAQSINEWLFPNVAMLYDDGNALRWEHHYSMNEPDDLLLSSLLPLAVQYFDLLPFRRPAKAEKAGEALPEPRRIDAKETTLCQARAVEKAGVVQIEVIVPRQVAFTVTKRVPFVEVVKVKVDGGWEEVKKTSYRTVTETAFKTVSETRVLIADGKKVQVTRKDGKVVEPRELPVLLKAESQVLLVTTGAIDPAAVQKLDEKTLIIRVSP